MKIFVLGQRLCGKTPFSRRVSAVRDWNHVEASEFLRSHFHGTDFEGMLLTHADMVDELVREELERNPLACSHYISRKLVANKTSMIDGLYDRRDFLNFFEPSGDVVVEIINAAGSVEPTTHELGLEDIKAEVTSAIANDRFDTSRIYRYKFDQFHRGRGSDTVVSQSGVFVCSSLDAAIGHFIQVMGPEASDS